MASETSVREQEVMCDGNNECFRLDAELARVSAQRDALLAKLADAEQQLEVLRPGGRYAWKSKCDALLEALKVVEWAWNAGPPKHQYCVCCGRWKQDGHNPVCRVALAIANAEGK